MALTPRKKQKENDMAAGPARGSAPEKFGKHGSKEETPTQEETNQAVEELKASEANQRQEEPELELDDSDLESLEQKIPYARFKEVNEEKKELKNRVEALESKSQEQIQSLVAQYEAKLQALQNSKSQSDYGIEYEEDATAKLEKQLLEAKQEINKLKSSFTETNTERELERLAARYPKANINAVLGWSKALPNSKLSDLMEKSHTDNELMVQEALRDILNQKKARAKANVPTGDTGIRIKPKEPIKSIKDAHQQVKEYFAGLNK